MSDSATTPIDSTALPQTKARRAATRIAYFINQYPKVSHSFIRREILALERLGAVVERFAIRGWDAEVVDKEDILERGRTRYVLRDGVGPLIAAVASTAYQRPRAFVSALAMAVRMSHRNPRPLPYHFVYLAHACRLRQWLEASGATHLHAHFGTNSAEVVMLTRLLGGPDYSFTVHGPEEFDQGDFLGLDHKIAHAKSVIAVNGYTRAQLFRRAAAADWGKIKQVHCGLEDAFHETVAEPVPDVARLVCVGRLCEQKGQFLLLQALRQLIDGGTPCHLVLAGDGEMRAELERDIAAYGLKDSVTITGWISSHEVRKQILAARALVLPSFAESLPVALMEAMSLRRPVITTYVAGIPELVEPGDSGWLVPAGTIAPLVAAMRECLTTPVAILSEMAAHAHARVRERHDVDTEAAKLLQLFESAASNSKIDEWQP